MNTINKFLGFILILVLLVRCGEDDLATKVNGVDIIDSDLIQVDDTNPNVTVYVQAQGSDLNSVKVSITPEGGGSEVYSNTLTKITTDKLNRVRVNVPFPTPDIAPSGMYNVTFSVNGSNKSDSYLIKVVNNRSIKYCDFPATPAGKVGIFVSVPDGNRIPAGTDVHIVGDFQGENGGSDWTVNDPNFKLTKLSDNCYYMFLSTFPTGAKYKIALGDWNKEFLSATGDGLSDQTHGGGNVNINVYNFKTLPINQYIVPEVLPNEAIKSGHNTVIVDVGSGVESSGKYYLIDKDATTLDGAIQMFPLPGSSKKLAAPVPLGSIGNEYKIVRDDVTNVAAASANPFGFDPVPYTFELEAETNPTYIAPTAIGFNNIRKSFPGLLLVGGSTPAGWNNSATNTQFFTKMSDIEYTITTDLTPADGYLVITQVGNWDTKIAKNTGTALAGTLAYAGGNNFDGPPAGTYKITLNLQTATFTVEPQ